jgi:hypothetical protein
MMQLRSFPQVRGLDKIFPIWEFGLFWESKKRLIAILV